MIKTKIVATIGPASNTRPMLEKLINAGMNVARLNFSHGTYEEHGEVIKTIRYRAINPNGLSVHVGLLQQSHADRGV